MQTEMVREPYEPTTTLITAKFPDNTWVKYKKGEKPSYDADSKLQIHMEYEFKLKGAIGMVLSRWKQLLRVKCGRKTFPMIGAAKKAQKNKMKKYIDLCNIHIAAMEALSGIELKGIKHIDDDYDLVLAEGVEW